MDPKARLLRLWEHACCGDRYWSGGRRCDKCGVEAYAVVNRVSLADSMARMHFHARPPAPLPATTPPDEISTPRLALAPRRSPIRGEEETEAPVALRDPRADAWLVYLLGLSMSGALVLLVAHMLASI